jgi:hypothetical protein
VQAIPKTKIFCDGGRIDGWLQKIIMKLIDRSSTVPATKQEQQRQSEHRNQIVDEVQTALNGLILLNTLGRKLRPSNSTIAAINTNVKDPFRREIATGRPGQAAKIDKAFNSASNLPTLYIQEPDQKCVLSS